MATHDVNTYAMLSSRHARNLQSAKVKLQIRHYMISKSAFQLCRKSRLNPTKSETDACRSCHRVITRREEALAIATERERMRQCESAGDPALRGFTKRPVVGCRGMMHHAGAC